MSETTPQDRNIGATVASSLNQNASLQNIFGSPIETQGKTIIPVAQVAMGLGGGYGRGKKLAEETDNAQGEGAGAGGGLYTIPRGVFEITAKRTRFVPMYSPGHFLLGTAVGLLLGWWLARRKE
ncbi:spore germination protein GerW family protein [Rufibacter psychrotolerans]|uniref:spore germination protein GerW family protein n=1 Tax=Rufibacter psychrotolerans TaxID=2812556 RepID=UPI001967C07C|nr:spore germination protein GerW family protein [Rufibacter sp. SYSU D00308]